MTALSGIMARRRVTPVRDFVGRRTPAPTPRTIPWGRLHDKLRRSAMFSLFFKLMKLAGFLFLVLLGMLLALNFRVVYRGEGQFAVESKERWAFENTFVLQGRPAMEAVRQALPRPPEPRPAPQPVRVAPPTPRVAPRPVPSALVSEFDQGLQECQTNRREIEEAVQAFNRRNPRNAMTELDIFSLLSAELLREIPNCPAGGEYRLEGGSKPRICCGRHID